MRYFIIFCVLLFTACSTKKNTDFPSLNQALHVKKKEQNDQALIEQKWWRDFGQKELNALIERALKNNLNVKQGKLSIEKSLLNLQSDKLSLLPRFSGNLGSNFSRKIDRGESKVSYGGNLALSYEVDILNKIQDKYEAGEQRVIASKEELKALKLTIVQKIINLYFNMAYLNDSLKLTQKSIQNYTKFHEITKAKYQFGKATLLETEQTKEALIDIKLSLAKLKSQQLSIKQELKNILNLKPHEKLPPLNATLKHIKPLHVKKDIPFFALLVRPNLKQAEANLRAKFIDDKAIKKSIYPTITLGGGISSQGKNLKDIFSFKFLSGNLQINLPFLDYNRVKNSIKASKIEYESAKLSFEQSITKALNELDTLYKEHFILETSYKSHQAQYDIQRKITQSQKDRYELGRSSLGDFLLATNKELSLKQNIKYQKYLILQSENRIFHALGGKI